MYHLRMTKLSSHIDCSAQLGSTFYLIRPLNTRDTNNTKLFRVLGTTPSLIVLGQKFNLLRRLYYFLDHLPRLFGNMTCFCQTSQSYSSTFFRKLSFPDLYQVVIDLFLDFLPGLMFFLPSIEIIVSKFRGWRSENILYSFLFMRFAGGTSQESLLS